MSVYIKGMEMPKNCMLCSFCVEEADPANGEMCMVTGKLMPPCNRERLDDCPLVPVPEHGDLIDRDKLMGAKLPNNRVYQGDERISYPPTVWQILDSISKAPAILPADKEERLFDSLKRSLEQAINGECRSEIITAEEMNTDD